MGHEPEPLHDTQPSAQESLETAPQSAKCVPLNPDDAAECGESLQGASSAEAMGACASNLPSAREICPTSTDLFLQVLSHLPPDEQQYVICLVGKIPPEEVARWKTRILGLPIAEAVAEFRRELECCRDLERIDEFIRRNLQWLLDLAARLAGRNDAKDVVQDACVHLVLFAKHGARPNVDAFRSDEALRALMYTITARRAFDILRKRKRKKECLTADGAFVERADDSAMRGSQAALDVDRLDRVYRRMRPVQRIVHVLHHYYQLTSADCVRVLAGHPVAEHPKGKALTISRVDAMIHHATRMLKCAMEAKP